METLSKTVAANDTEQPATLFVALELSAGNVAGRLALSDCR